MCEAYNQLKKVCERLKGAQGGASDTIRYVLNASAQKCQKEVINEVCWNNAWQTGIPLSESAVAQMVKRVTPEFEKKADGTYFCNERFLNATLRFVGVTKKYTSDEKNIHAYYRVEVCLKGEVTSHEISANKVRYTDWLTGIAGVSYDKNIKGNPYGKLIEQEIDNFKGKVQYVYPRTGWKKCGEFLDYLLPDGFIYGDRDAEVRVPYSWSASNKSRNSAVDVEILLNKILFVTEKEKAGMMLFLYTQLSYLATLFKMAKFPIKYVFALIGERGSMKTSLVQAISLGCWEDPMKELQVPFISTAAGIESVIDSGADRVVLVDDYKPTLDRYQKTVLQTNLELVTRIFGDETGKKRNTDFLNPEVEKKYILRAVDV